MDIIDTFVEIIRINSEKVLNHRQISKCTTEMCNVRPSNRSAILCLFALTSVFQFELVAL